MFTSLLAQGVHVHQPPISTNNEAAAENTWVLLYTMPFSIIGSAKDVTTTKGCVVNGRECLLGITEGMFQHLFPIHLLPTLSA